MKKKRSFSTNLLISILGAIILVFAITIFFITSYSLKTAESDAKNYINELAEKYANNLESIINESIVVNEIFTARIQEAINLGNITDGDEMANFMRSILNNNNEFISVWVDLKTPGLAFEIKKNHPNKNRYDENGQFRPYIMKTKNGIKEQATYPYNEENSWLKGPKTDGKTHITEPYIYPVDGVNELITSIATPIYKEKQFVGVLGADILIDTIANISKTIKIYKHGYAFVVDPYGVIVGHPDKTLLGKKLLNVTKNDSDYITLLRKSKNDEDHSFYKKSSSKGLNEYYYSKPFELGGSNIKWTIILNVPKNEYLSNAIFIRNFSIIISILGTLIITGIIVFSVRKLTKAKDEVQMLNNTLEKKVKIRTKELEESNKNLKLKTLELEDLNNTLDNRIKEEINNRKKQEQILIQQSKLAEMGEMISMIAHQWRQPLSALSNIIQNIHLRYSIGKLDKEYLENQRLLGNALTKKMSATIEDFRNFFKPNKEKQYFSIKDAIDQTIFLIDDSFKSHNIRITNQILGNVTIYGFESELSQVLLNLIKNSKDAFLEKQIENPSISIKTKQVSTHIKILISDNAGGINKLILDKIFEPYFTTKDSYNGTGLGLYMSKIIIEQNMQGQLSVKNTKDGVQFTIYIPIN